VTGSQVFFVVMTGIIIAGVVLVNAVDAWAKRGVAKWNSKAVLPQAQEEARGQPGDGSL
jgi:uncharacterized iron-regulated membrane protein